MGPLRNRLCDKIPTTKRDKYLSKAIEQQTALSREMNQSIHSISSVAVQTSENVRQSVTAGESLSELTEHLKALVSHFRVRS